MKRKKNNSNNQIYNTFKKIKNSTKDIKNKTEIIYELANKITDILDKLNDNRYDNYKLKYHYYSEIIRYNNFYKITKYKNYLRHYEYCLKQDNNLIKICNKCYYINIDYSNKDLLRGDCECGKCGNLFFKSYKVYNCTTSLCIKCGNKIYFDREK